MKTEPIKINIEKCVKLTEMYELRKIVNYNEKSKNWWNTAEGLAQKEKNKENVKKALTALKNTDYMSQKIHYRLEDLETNDVIDIYGNKEVALYLGYKYIRSFDDVIYLTNKEHTKTFKITKIKEN